MSSGGKLVVYMPTFRDTGGTFLADKALDIPLLNAFCKKHKIFFLAKFHPSMGISVEGSLEAFAVYDSAQDIYPFLPLADALITDYSSIYFDFMLIDKPLIFYPYDKERYLQQDREFFFEYEDVTPGVHVTTQDELLKAIYSATVEGQDDHASSRRLLRDKAFGCIDAGASARVCEWIKSKIIY